MIKRKLILIMENKPGALVRVVGLFHQRGYNIETLHVDSVKDFSTYKDIEKKLEKQVKKLTKHKTTKHKKKKTTKKKKTRKNIIEFF